jgi:hypothetical protein
MDLQLFDNLQHTLQQGGPCAAIDRLCQELQERKDYAGLFYALLMKKRHELGVSPVPTGSNQDLPPAAHEPFEDGIRTAARQVGELYLRDGQIPQAWSYYRMLGETAPIAAALEQVTLREDEDCQPLIDIAFHQGILPVKGFDWVLQRYGICSAITTLSGGELPFPPDVRAACIRTLVRALHAELMDRLRGEIARQQGFAPTGKSIPELIEGRDWLFSDDYYHIDLSHLNATVQMATQLDGGDELHLARELCAYGKRLSPRFRYQSDPPFEDQYVDYDKYLSILTGEDVEGGLAHFRAKADAADPDTIGTYPAEVLVNLLLRLGRGAEALQVARKHLANLGERRFSCPSIVELCQQTGRYDVLAEVARDQGHVVNYLAGLIAATDKSIAK